MRGELVAQHEDAGQERAVVVLPVPAPRGVGRVDLPAELPVVAVLEDRLHRRIVQGEQPRPPAPSPPPSPGRGAVPAPALPARRPSSVDVQLVGGRGVQDVLAEPLLELRQLDPQGLEPLLASRRAGRRRPGGTPAPSCRGAGAADPWSACRPRASPRTPSPAATEASFRGSRDQKADISGRTAL